MATAKKEPTKKKAPAKKAPAKKAPAKKRGRPKGSGVKPVGHDLTQKDIDKICAYIEMGASRDEAAGKHRITHTKFFDWCREGRKPNGHPMCKKLVEEIEFADAAAQADDSIALKKATKNDARSLLWRKQHFSSLKHMHEMRRLEKELAEAKLQAVKLDNEKTQKEIKRIEEEINYRELTNEALRIAKEGPGKTTYQEEVAKMQGQMAQITPEQIAEHYRVPSAEEDEAHGSFEVSPEEFEQDQREQQGQDARREQAEQEQLEEIQNDDEGTD